MEFLPELSLVITPRLIAESIESVVRHFTENTIFKIMVVAGENAGYAIR